MKSEARDAPGSEESDRPMGGPEVFLSLGANLGDPLQQLRDALRELSHAARLVAISSVYRTQPMGIADQPDFFNLVCSARTDLSPHELLRAILAIEAGMGRLRGSLNAPREIDIDILSYGSLVLESPDLVLPHPRLHLRNFVLLPLLEIAPHWLHPLSGLSVAELVRSGESRGGVARLSQLNP